MAKSVSEKMGVKENMRAVLIDAPDDAVSAMELPAIDLKDRLSGKFDYIHLFAKNQAVFHKRFPKLMKNLQPAGMLWVSWPKSGKLDTDLNIKIVIKLGYDYGLVESKAIKIDETWSALKFTWPRENVEYKNSYGKLK